MLWLALEALHASVRLLHMQELHPTGMTERREHKEALQRVDEPA